jgi:hypothetical protein
MQSSALKSAILVAIFVTGLISPPAYAQAKIDFASYEGPPKIVEGEGGTKIAKTELTTGLPEHRPANTRSLVLFKTSAMKLGMAAMQSAVQA